MFKYLWLITILLFYIPWTLCTLIDFVRIFSEHQIAKKGAFDAFYDWIYDHETWVMLHLAIFVILFILSFGTWAQMKFGL